MDAAQEAESLHKLLVGMQEYNTAIPDEVTDHFLKHSGFECPDPRVTRLVSLAAHKFVADLTNDALQHCKNRQAHRAQGKSGKGDMRFVLTMDDLASSAREYGIHIKRPQFYANAPASQSTTGEPRGG